ncbi:MAG: cell wall synthase accessory phosphoprotein MacP [Streptococcaceae bacterium]|jgi:hypothetical protein|nr:cell wall synthase accessory phosphoprotein MacP [Streptococcaceae bacterium]
MAKPILTDEMIDDANRDRAALEADIRRGMQRDEALIKKYDEKERALAKNSTHKSRRIETAKSSIRGKKLTKYIIISWVILAAFIYYIIKWG